MAIDIKECTLNRMVFAVRDINSNQLMVDSVNGPVHPTFSLTPNIIIKKGDIGFVRTETFYSPPLSGITRVSVSYGSFSYWMDPDWLSLESPSFALPGDIAKLISHIRKLENQIKAFDESDRITELINEINTLTEHVKDVEDERNVYLDAFSLMGLDGIDANYIAVGKVCPKCFELFTNHNSDGSCVSDNEDDNQAYDDNGVLWKEHYMADQFARYEDAIIINEFEDGNPDWDWEDIEKTQRSELHRRGITYAELNIFKEDLIREKTEEDWPDYFDDKEAQLKAELNRAILDENMTKFDDCGNDDDIPDEDDITLNPDEIY